MAVGFTGWLGGRYCGSAGVLCRGGVTLVRGTGADGHWAEEYEDAADALRRYAEMIENAVPDVAEYLTERSEMEADTYPKPSTALRSPRSAPTRTHCDWTQQRGAPDQRGRGHPR